MLLVALGAGWAANQEGSWPFLGWFAPYGEQGRQEAKAVVQPIAEPDETPEPAPPAATEPEIERAEHAPPPTQEPAAERSAAAGGASPVPASPGDASNPSASNPGETKDQSGAGNLAGATGVGDQTGVRELAGAAAADDPTGAEDLAAEGSAAQDPGSPSGTLAAGVSPAEAHPARTERAAAMRAVLGAEGTAEQPSASDMAAIPPTGDPPALGDAAAGSTDDAAAPQAAAGMIGNPAAPPAAESGSVSQQSEGSGAEAAAIAPGNSQEPGVGDASADAAGDDPAQEVTALLSDAKTTAPSFDIVRVEPDGRAVIAGRAAPGAEVELRSGEEVIDRVRASRRGDWVAIPGKPLSPGDQQLSAVASQKGAPAVPSEQIVVVAVPERALPIASQASVVVPQPPVAVLLPRTGRGTGRILQAPGRLSAQGTLALITVGYDQLGQMLLSGEAPPGVPVRVYVDNQPMALVVGDAKGTWSSGLDRPLAPGTYTLRLDQLDAQGQTVARIETPITRVSEPPIEGELQVDYVVVQPGNSLWRIARRLTGRGVDYVYIYDSNQAQIRDPDLIFPGQVFQIPAEVGGAG